ncbi:MAG TPA: hypothetical protein VNS88_05155, partial [Nitrospiraceae bacterium]|nr:hypothetical protein [Nitrospiraceae bacterium]
NGSLFYLPALAALIVVGLLLEERRHRAAPYLLWAAAILAVSVTLRTLDMALCEKIVIEGREFGTHFAWHMLNALALFLLLRASLEGGLDAVRVVEIQSAPEEFAESEAARTFLTEAPIVEPQARVEATPPQTMLETRKLLTERVASATPEAAKEGTEEEMAAKEDEKTLLPA